MKKLIILTVAVMILIPAITFSQYKERDLSNPVNRTTNNLILGIFNPKNFSMQHSLQVSMISSPFGNISVTSYVNSMMYKFSDKFTVSADVKLQYSPYASSAFGKSYASQMQNDLTGLKLSRLSMDYKISDNSSLRFEFRNYDYGMYNNGYFGDPFQRNEIWR